MANISPFRGIRYNPAVIEDISQVVSQPYDRIRYGLQDKYYAQSEYSIAKIIKGKSLDSDNQEGNVYTRSRGYLDAWLDQGTMIREGQPALYVLQQKFSLPGSGIYTRKGFITAFEISTFDEGIVLPHERTLSGPKIDRLKLTRATETYFGQIFMLYPDEKNNINAILDNAIGGMKPLVVRDLYENDVEQRLWVITDSKTIDKVLAEMAPKRNLIIADGHHRYETAISFRDSMRSLHPDAPSSAAFNYRMVTLVSISDPGLVILPTHRLIHSYSKLSSKQVIEKAKAYFKVIPLSDQSALKLALMEATPEAPRIGFYDGSSTILILKSPEAMAEIAPDRDPAWRMLDVSILHELLIQRIMGLSKESVERKENIDYLRDVKDGYSRVDNGNANFMFVLNPTRMGQVQKCTSVGEKMPQKSTDFYPKIISGLVAMPVGPKEVI
jgi:uncharacterized protein (DUF1015 family)